MDSKSSKLIFFMLLVSLSFNARAAILFSANLSGSQEVPAVSSPGTGFGSVLLSDDQSNISVSLNFSGLLAAQTAAHIHGPAAPGVNGPIVFPLPLGQITNAVFAVTPAQVNTLINGLFYFNVHSQPFPAGEIRGQIQAVPEPAPWGLVLLGAAALATRTWRKSLSHSFAIRKNWVVTLP